MSLGFPEIPWYFVFHSDTHPHPLSPDSSFHPVLSVVSLEPPEKTSYPCSKLMFIAIHRTSPPSPGPRPWHSFLFFSLFTGTCSDGHTVQLFHFCALPRASNYTPPPAGNAISSFLLAFPGSIPRNFSKSLSSSCDSQSSELPSHLASCMNRGSKGTAYCAVPLSLGPRRCPVNPVVTV